MATARRSRWLLASALGHAAVLALLLALPRPARVAPVTRLRVTEFDLTAPPVVTRPMPPPPAIAAPRVTTEPSPAPVAAPRVTASRPRASVAATTATPEPSPAPIAAPRVTTAQPPVAAPPVVITTPPALRAADLLRPTTDALALPVPAPSTAPSGPGRAGYFGGSTGTDAERALAATQGFVRETLAATTVREAPGVRTYLWNVRRRVAEAWRPGVVRVPNLGDTLMASFIAPERAMRIFGARVMRRQQQVLEAQPRLGGAVDAIEAIGGVSGQGLTSNRPSMATNTSDESWRRNVRTTRAEVQVDQDENGRVLGVTLLHHSGIDGFDRAAIDAVRRGLDEQDPMPLPGGRRSLWSFTVIATRRLFTPNIGGAFDESRGWFRVEVPGSVTMRSRVQMESSAPRPATP